MTLIIGKSKQLFHRTSFGIPLMKFVFGKIILNLKFSELSLYTRRVNKTNNAEMSSFIDREKSNDRHESHDRVEG